MGGMDTEVSVIRYSMLNQSAKKSSPHIEVLAESADPQLGSKDVELVIVEILADRFNALPEREGKEDVRKNVRAIKRVFKEALKIKEILSANKAASVKIPELLDYVTLKFELQREELESRLTDFLAKVTVPIDAALERAGLTVEDIDQVELLGGGIRNPKIVEILEKHMKREAGVHLNGDEAMCFGSAFIATNSSSAFKVKQVYLTQNVPHDVWVKISPVDPKQALTEEEQKAEGAEEDDIIKYWQDFKLFNTSDYLGKSKGLSLNYPVDLKIELFKREENEAEDGLLLDSFQVTGVKSMIEQEV